MNEMTMSTECSIATDKLVVISGASTSIGAATARELARRGFHVLAGVRRESDADALRSQHVEPHILDITNGADVAGIAERVAGDARGRPLHALVNNAAIAVNAPVETLPMDEWRSQFEVNLFSQIAMTQALLPALLQSTGRVVNISSVGGKVAMATYGAYAGAKFALEAVSDSLRREVSDFGVEVIVVEPGAVITEMSRRGVANANRLAAGMTADQRRRYDGLVHAVTTQAESFTQGGVPAAKAATIIADAITATKPRTRYTVGRDAAVLVRLARVAPDRFLDRMLRRNLKPHYQRADQLAAQSLRALACRPVGVRLPTLAWESSNPR
jgi:NAD(P)-dependent dehydrogenase (short-subunit alcohol dehydrogenase family)